MKRLFKIAGTLAIITAFLLLGLVGIAYVYEDEIVDSIKGSINDQIDSKVSVKSISFSLIDRFPNASFKFSNPWIEDKLSPGDTLLSAESLFLEFDILQLISEEYIIQKARVENGQLTMRTDDKGQANYIFWKKSDSKDHSVAFEVDELTLSSMHISYADPMAEFSLSADIKEMGLNVKSDERGIDVNVKSNQHVNSLLIAEKNYLNDLELSIEGPLWISADASQIDLKGIEFDVEGNAIPILGTISKDTEQWSVALSASGSTDLASVMKLLPEEDKAGLRDYKSDGDVDYDITVEGPAGSGQVPLVTIAFEARQAHIKELKSGVILDDISTKGTFSTLKNGSERIEFARFNAELGSNDFKITGALENFDSPWINAQVDFGGEVHDMMEFFHLDSAMTGQGEFAVRAQIKGPMPRSEKEMAKLNKLQMSGECVLKDLNLSFADGKQNLNDLNGEISLRDKDISLPDMRGKLNGSEFAMSGLVSNFVPYLLSDKEELRIKADFSSPLVRLDDWFKDQEDAEGDMRFSLSDDIGFDLKIHVDKLTYQDFIAEEVVGLCTLRKGVFNALPISFRSASGEVKGELSVMEKKEGHFLATCRVDLKDIDVPRAFREFDNFGQEFLQDKHIKGVADASISYSCQFNEALDIDMNSLNTVADLSIRNGELIEHSSMVDIMAALKSKNLLKPFVRVDELEKEVRHIHFAELNNRIRINNGKIDIPEMLIASNAMDLYISGTHGFDNMVDYKFNFRLREILVNKSNPDFYVEDDGLGHRIYLRMHGPVDDPDIEMDKGAVKASRQEAIAEAKTDIKDFFKDPLGKNRDEPKKESKAVITIVEFEDDEEEIDVKKEAEKKKNATGIFGKIDFESEDEDLDDDDF